MPHLHLLSKFLNKIKSKYLEESGVEGKGSRRQKAPLCGFLGHHRECDYSQKDDWCLAPAFLRLPGPGSERESSGVGPNLWVFGIDLKKPFASP